MFPLIHHYCNKAIIPHVDNAVILGGLFPDLALNAGIFRSTAHASGYDLYHWCLNNDHLNDLKFVEGVISHGDSPMGVDYYSDEYWPFGDRGYCFQNSEPFVDKVDAATHLSDTLTWWKTHNFIEMAFELIVDKRDPALKQEIQAAVEDEETIDRVCSLVSVFYSVKKQKMIDAYKMVPDIFALDEVTPRTLAEKQQRSFELRHNCFDSNLDAMIKLLEEMEAYFEPKFDPFITSVQRLVHDMMKSIL